MKQNKTLEEIKKEFEEKFIDTSSQLYMATGNCINQKSGDLIWSWVTYNFVPKSTISQTKQEERERTLMELYRSGEIQTKDGPIFDPRQVVGRLVRLIAGLEKLSNK